jgi:hypothetical protein
MADERLIEAVAEIRRFKSAAPWPVLPDAPAGLIRLHAGVTDEEVGSIMFSACLSNRIEVSPDAAVTLRNFIADGGFILPGGLRLLSGGREVVPGCCCGLEDWHEWLDVPRGGKAVWTGHDPSSEIEFVGDKVRVWKVEKRAGGEFVEFGLEEMAAHLRQVTQDLVGFVYRLGKWAENVAPGMGQSVSSYFADSLKIPVGRA